MCAWCVSVSEREETMCVRERKGEGARRERRGGGGKKGMMMKIDFQCKKRERECETVTFTTDFYSLLLTQLKV